MIYFTSDWHIGHDKPFLYEPRGFTNIIDHDTAVVKKCNEIVRSDDELWILGDLALNPDNENEWNRIYYNLNCQHVHFVQGNHDSDNRIDKYINEYWFEYHGYVDVLHYSKHKTFYLSHYPTITDNFDDNKRNHVINLYGHTHQSTNFYQNNPYMYHVGLDSHNLYPVSIEQIIEDINKQVKIERGF